MNYKIFIGLVISSSTINIQAMFPSNFYAATSEIASHFKNSPKQVLAGAAAGFIAGASTTNILATLTVDKAGKHPWARRSLAFCGGLTGGIAGTRLENQFGIAGLVTTGIVFYGTQRLVEYQREQIFQSRDEVNSLKADLADVQKRADAAQLRMSQSSDEVNSLKVDLADVQKRADAAQLRMSQSCDEVNLLKADLADVQKCADIQERTDAQKCADIQIDLDAAQLRMRQSCDEQEKLFIACERVKAEQERIIISLREDIARLHDATRAESAEVKEQIYQARKQCAQSLKVMECRVQETEEEKVQALKKHLIRLTQEQDKTQQLKQELVLARVHNENLLKPKVEKIKEQDAMLKQQAAQIQLLEGYQAQLFVQDLKIQELTDQKSFAESHVKAQLEELRKRQTEVTHLENTVQELNLVLSKVRKQHIEQLAIYAQTNLDLQELCKVSSEYEAELESHIKDLKAQLTQEEIEFKNIKEAPISEISVSDILDDGRSSTSSLSSEARESETKIPKPASLVSGQSLRCHSSRSGSAGSAGSIDSIGSV